MQTLKPDPVFQSQHSSLSGCAASDKVHHPLYLHFTSLKWVAEGHLPGLTGGDRLLLVGKECLGRAAVWWSLEECAGGSTDPGGRSCPAGFCSSSKAPLWEERVRSPRWAKAGYEIL